MPPRDETWRQAAARILRAQAVQMEAHLLGVLNDADPEHLHNLRVALRRSRCALQLFREDLGPERCQSLRTALGRVARPLGQVRDLDLLLARLPRALAQTGASDGESLAALLMEERRRRREDLLPLLLSRPFQRARQALHRVRTWAGVRAARPLAPDIPALLWQAATPLHALRKRPIFTEAELHALRIRLKTLRYTLEFLGGGGVRPIIRLQDCLGALQDHRSGVGILVALAGEPGLEPARAELLGELAQVERRGIRERGAEFLGLWRARRGWWKRFRP
jgi:CHAD domain-containing protein